MIWAYRGECSVLFTTRVYSNYTVSDYCTVITPECT